jgi:hypothetical protein
VSTQRRVRVFRQVSLIEDKSKAFPNLKHQLIEGISVSFKEALRSIFARPWRRVTSQVINLLLVSGNDSFVVMKFGLDRIEGCHVLC